MSPTLILTVFSVAALAALLTIAVWRTLVGSSGTQYFENVISTITGGEVAEFNSTLLKSKKTKQKWTWQKWWLDATLKAGRSVSDDGVPGRFMIGVVIILTLFGIFVYPGNIMGAYFGLLSIALARMWLSFETGKRKMALERQMPMLLSGLRSQMDSGATIQKAIIELATDFPNPLGDEIRRVRDDVNVAIPLSKALEALAERVNSRLMQFLVSSLGVGIKSGADLVPQIVTLEEIIRMRARIDGKIRSAVALAKPTAYLAEGAPVGIFIWMSLSDPKYLPYFFGPGLLILIVSLVMYALGIVAIQFMIKNVENV